MDKIQDKITMLNQMPSPAFLVKDGIITNANSAAQRHMITEGSPISDLLATGAQEYKNFQEGCLYLTLNICGTTCGVSVTKMQEHDYFVVEQESDQSELQSMALAAQQLRSPLSNVMTVADRLFPMSCFDDNPAALDQAARINRGLFQLLRIVSNMSDAYRYSQEAAPNMEIREICGFLQGLFDENAPLIQHTGVTLHFTNLKEPIYCLIDAEKLERAVSNILSNALKFNVRGGTIDAKLTRSEKMLYLVVRNTNAGQPENAKANPYSQYQRQPGVQDSRYGIGLGMVLIRQAAAAHGGTVLIEQGSDSTRVTMTIAIRQTGTATVRSNIFRLDYAGERDHRLLEFSESLPAELYQRDIVN